MSRPGSLPVPDAVREHWRDLRIRTPRLELRPIEVTDGPATFAWFNDWEVVKQLTGPPWPYTLADADRFARASVAAREEGREFGYAMLAHGGALIGTIAWRIWPANRVQDATGPNIGYSLARSHWGQGLMSEAVVALIARVFASTEEPAIYSGALAENVGSLRVLAKAGFVETGMGTLPTHPDRVEKPLVKVTLTRERWMARQ